MSGDSRDDFKWLNYDKPHWAILAQATVTYCNWYANKWNLNTNNF